MQDQARYGRGLCAERYPNADFIGVLRSGTPHYPIYSDPVLSYMNLPENRRVI